MIWDGEADALLIRLWDEGGSLSYVADGLQQAGYVVSRNAVAGRKNRLSKAAFKRVVAKPIKVIQPRKRKRDESVNKKAPSRRPVTVAEVEALTLHAGIEYLDQTSYGCKAIMPTRGGAWKLQRVCGQPRSLDYNGSKSPYCLTHFRLFTNPAPFKRQHA